MPDCLSFSKLKFFMSVPRKLTIYERNQLLKYSLKENDLLTKGNLPVEYLTGFVNFCGFDVKVDKNVLIPRVETEELVGHVLNFTQTLDKPLRYLEVGTGSGAISLAIFAALQKNRQPKLKKFMVSDVSLKALELTKKNFRSLFDLASLREINFVASDLLAAIAPQAFDVIVANLPYIPTGDMDSLDASVKDYEPSLALDGGETGFELIARLLEQIVAGGFLSVGGKIFLEVHETHTKDFVKQYFPDIFARFAFEEIRDQNARQRFLVLQSL